jgi:hypothetical protein
MYINFLFRLLSRRTKGQTSRCIKSLNQLVFTMHFLTDTSYRGDVMQVTMANVRAVLNPEEPDYNKASKLGEGALTFLTKLVQGSDLLLAAKATSLAGRIGGKGAIPILTIAAKHADASLRVAAAGAAKDLLPELAILVLPTLLTDRDSGVRKVAVRSAASKVVTPKGAKLRVLLKDMSQGDPDPRVRVLARKLIG